MSSGSNDEPSSPNRRISWPVNRPKEQGEWSQQLDSELRAREASTIQPKSPDSIPRDFYPGEKRGLSNIAIRAFLLGLALGLCSWATVTLAWYQSHLWRPAFFVATLSVFHFLEFYTTAAYNTPKAYVASFLLTNGDQYRQANIFALVETTLTSYFLPQWQSRVSPPLIIFLGLVMVTVGQTVRSLAMVQAGTNFNHTVQSRKSEGHELVNTGLYSVFRHPSYFGFFWWGIGTQVVLGNSVSLVGYTCVLYYFFRKRITHEEKHLVDFFGKDYEDYRAKTRVWIPFIR